jgi:periplasmic copper chaperone A
MRQHSLLGALVLLSLGLGACGSPAPSPQSLPPVAMAGQIGVFEPRVRLPAFGRDQTAAYMVLINQGDKPDRLIGAKTKFASTVELHTHGKGSDGMTMMRQIRDIEIPPKATLSLNPGGLHVMLKGIKQNVEAGQSVPMTLLFASGAQANFMMPIVVNPTQPVDGADGAGGEHKH